MQCAVVRETQPVIYDNDIACKLFSSWQNFQAQCVSSAAVIFAYETVAERINLSSKISASDEHFVLNMRPHEYINNS